MDSITREERENLIQSIRELLEQSDAQALRFVLMFLQKSRQLKEGRPR